MIQLFRRFSLITVFAVFFLIMVGSIVRTTGSGMGCPDWPKCFGQWIPPTDISQLPENYKEIFKVQGKEIADFEAFKTWIEYVNRLVGMLIGFSIFITFILSLWFWKKDKAVTLFSFLAFVLVGFQGWLGSVVVSTNLGSGIITLHMVVALIIVAVLIYVVYRSYGRSYFFQEISNRRTIMFVLIISITLLFVQIVFGTQVRENIDHLAKTMGESQRNLWIDNIGIMFYIHRSFSIILLGMHLYLLYLINKNSDKSSTIRSFSSVLIGIIVLEIVSGIVMAYLSMPKVAQPMHLLFASLAFGVQFLIFLALNSNKRSTISD